jgi:hypothetical protein
MVAILVSNLAAIFATSFGGKFWRQILAANLAANFGGKFWRQILAGNLAANFRGFKCVFYSSFLSDSWLRSSFFLAIFSFMDSMKRLISSRVLKHKKGQWNNSTFKKCKQLFEYQHLLLLETSGGQCTNVYLNAVHFFNTSVH